MTNNEAGKPIRYNTNNLVLANVDTLSEVFANVMDERVDESQVPQVVHQAACSLLSETVQLLREGSLADIRTARTKLDKTGVYAIRRAESAEEARQLAGYVLNTINTVLHIGERPFSGTEYAVLRKPDHLAAKLLCTIADLQPTPEDWYGKYISQETLRASVAGRDIDSPLCDLCSANMISFDTGPFMYTDTNVRLSPQMQQPSNPEIMVLARYYAEQFDIKNTAEGAS